MKQALLNYTDEALCRLSNYKIKLAAVVGKRLLPGGFWGEQAGYAGLSTNAGGDYFSLTESHAESSSTAASSSSAPSPHLYLTFDDGPHPNTTPYLLEALEAQNVRATFFLIGANCQRYPQLVQAIHDAGHVIGNHSYNHVPMPLIGKARLQSEIIRTSETIADITGLRPEIFRPPYGIMDARTAACLSENNLTPVYWGSAPEDWSVPGAYRVVRRVMWDIADGTLIVLHEGEMLKEQTITAAKEIVYRCKSLGYQFSKVKVRAGFQAS